MSVVREREDDNLQLQRSPKRTKVENVATLQDNTDVVETTPSLTSKEEQVAIAEPIESETILPPSHSLLGIPSPEAKAGALFRISESDVGISEYIGHDVPKIEGIIKQRFTDFLVFEINQDGEVIHIKSLAKPESSPKAKKATETSLLAAAAVEASTTGDAMQCVEDAKAGPSETTKSTPLATIESEPIIGDESIVEAETLPKIKSKEKDGGNTEPWPERFTTALQPFLSDDAIAKVKQMFLEGREPPRAIDSGWGGRKTRAVEDGAPTADAPELHKDSERGGKGKRGRDRGGRGGRGGGRIPPGREDNRKVVTDPIESKATRAALHQTIRELFGSKLDTETDTTTPASENGPRIVIKWARGGGGRGGSRSGGGRDHPTRGTFPPYIHFTLQKTNRDTQDALAHLSRILHVNVKDMSVAGTKDKRGVTVQRVSLKRGNKTVEDIWRLANGKNLQEALIQRGDRGVRIADLNYRKASLELGMLKGNAFVITLRNVQVDSMETIEKALNTIKNKGFINYYGMQRFGTASIPTHSIGLALLKSDWHRAVSLILRKRPGENPDVVAAREAWLQDGDLDRALELMPRRVIAERCILESYKKQSGETRNAMGALSTIPKNLRLMYVHAYQSYVWNAIVSERIRTCGSDKPVVGDLVFDTDLEKPAEEPDMVIDSVDGETPAGEQPAGEEVDLSSAKAHNRARKAWVAPKVKTLTADDIDKYTIFDVIMPLPGTDVDYPGGKLGERYRAFLEADGLDPDNFVRKQREYTLGGSYRKILHLPKELSWSVLRYTDPDVALAQADEDKLLGFDPPVVVEDGKFLALQVYLTLGTAAYATMALREVTKTETSSYFQTSLTQASEDQKYRALEVETEK